MNSSKELKKLVKLVAQARNAVKNAGNQIAEAHAQSVAYDLPGREIIGHLRDLNDGLYGLAIYCQREVELALSRQADLDTPETGKVVSRAKWPHGKPDTAGELAWLRKHAAADKQGQSLRAPCPKCQRQVLGLVGAINSCGGCGQLLRRHDTGEWFALTAEAALKEQVGAQVTKAVCASIPTAVRQAQEGIERVQSEQRNKKAHVARRNQKG